jgi:DNA repair exonuclease SbcCD nuclease subunit
MDYWALGHVHERAYLGTEAPWIVYPGNLQGRGTATSERGPKGAIVVDVEDDAIRAVSFVAVDRVRSVEIEVEVSDVADATSLEKRLLDEAGRMRETQGDRGVLLEVTLTGMGVLPASCRDPKFRRTLVERLRQRTANDQPFLWWTAVRDRTPLPLAIDELPTTGELTATLLRRRHALLQDAVTRNAFLEKQFAPLERVWIAELEPSEVEDLFREATELALDLVRRGSPA